VTVHQGVASPNGGNGQVTITNDPGSGSSPAPSDATTGAAVAVVGVPRFTG